MTESAEAMQVETPAAAAAPAATKKDKVVVVHNKRTLEVYLDLSADALPVLQEELSKLSGVAPALQKLINRGQPLKDPTRPLSQLGVAPNCKLLLVGAPITEIAAVAEKPPPETLASAFGAALLFDATPQDLGLGEGAQQKMPHKRVLEKGPPEDRMPGDRTRRETKLPATPLTGMLNSRGEKIRLTFKVFNQELWLASASTTDRIPFGTIRAMASEPIVGHEDWSIIALQLGKTEASRLFVYWVPTQWVSVIRQTIG